jgi:hypothetical protein
MKPDAPKDRKRVELDDRWEPLTKEQWAVVMREFKASLPYLQVERPEDWEWAMSKENQRKGQNL